jgi:hypothetical protein
MQLLNATKMQAGYTMGLKPDGRESLVVVVKGTFAIPDRPDAEPRLTDKQLPLVMADTFSGEPGFSAPVYESDYAPFKPRCDVLLHGSAYAPRGQPVKRVNVSLRVGSLAKSFDVVGKRTWQTNIIGALATEPEPFDAMPISYANAFGGIDRSFKDKSKYRYYLPNIAGVGFHVNTDIEAIQGKPLPNTEEPGHPVTSPHGKNRPMAFGPIGRGWPMRARFAGTYDQNWIDNVFPFLPADFDERYFQSAPEDQQIDFLRGGEQVELHNLTPEGITRFHLPRLEMPITFYLRKYEPREAEAVADTLILEPDLGRFVVAWRASLPLKQNVFEVLQAVAGTMPPAWYRARRLGKTWYPSLKQLVHTRRQERAEVAETDEDEFESVTNEA